MQYGVSMTSIILLNAESRVAARARRARTLLPAGVVSDTSLHVHKPRPPAPARVTPQKGSKCSKGTTQHVVYRSMHLYGSPCDAHESIENKKSDTINQYDGSLLVGLTGSARCSLPASRLCDELLILKLLLGGARWRGGLIDPGAGRNCGRFGFSKMRTWLATY